MKRIVASVVVLAALTFGGLTQDALGQSCRRRSRKRAAPPARPSKLTADEGRLGQFVVIGDTGTGTEKQKELAEVMFRYKAGLPLRVRPDDGRQHVRGREGRGLQAEVRGHVQAAAGRQGQVLRLARQPRRVEPAVLRTLQHERRGVLQAQEGQRRLLRAQQQLHGQAAAQVARRRAGEGHLRVEDRLLPPPALLVGRQARLRARSCARSSSRSS